MSGSLQPADHTRIEDVIKFWLGIVDHEGKVPPERKRRWFKSDIEFDRQIRDRYEELVGRAGRGELDHWRQSARGALALVILCDQFPRNIYRGSAHAFDHDGTALQTSRAAIEAEQHHELRAIERAFLYMPFQHAEDRGAQKQSVELFRELASGGPEAIRDTLEEFRDWAVSHRDVIERFGRFPHRNELLGRESTEEERAYLAENGGFG